MKDNAHADPHASQSRNDQLTSRSASKTLARILIFAALILFAFVTPPGIQAQSCPNIPSGGGESLSASISISATGQPVGDQGLAPAGTVVRIDAVATAFGDCTGMACCCVPTGAVYNRTVGQIYMTADISTTTGLNGSYSLGSVFGRNPDGTTASLNVLDTQAANSTGPKYFTLSHPGTYQFYIQASIYTTPCNIQPNQTQMITITLQVGDGDDSINSGKRPCENEVGKPVNVTNGNMYIQQTDYQLPGFGEGLEITRTYNSKKQSAGLFGYGWSSILDESITTYGTTLMRLSMADGSAVYLTRPSGASTVYTSTHPANYAQVVKNVDNTYTLTFKDGRVHQFNTAGKLVSFADQNGNAISLTYNGSGNPVTITDASGRTVNLTYNGYTKIATMSDSLGTIATYTHAFMGRLTSVTYADGSKFVFTDVFAGSKVYLTTVKDALNNVLESHTYDSQGRALTSEVAGNGTERYTLTYVSASQTDVTDALGHVTKYFFDTSKGRNVVTQVEGLCGCGGSQIQSWSYDSQLNVTSKTDALNHTFTYTYNSAGDRLIETDATGTVTYTYNALGQVLTRTDQMGGVTTNTYSSQGNLLTTKDALNHTTTFTYGASG
ncbi:MAG: DUF6531 domain-containing protein, partial [Pyrinomonadaceae bacterium]